MYQYRRIIISGIAALLVLSMLAGLIVMIVQAKSSDEIQGEIDSLQEQAEQLASDREALNDEIAANQEKTLSIVEQKSQLDRDIELTQQEIENTVEQIHQYSCLIAEKQAELDELEQEQSDLLQHYKLRMRTIQERGGISRWAVILHAADFADMLNRRAMVEEIAASDQRMMDELRSVAGKVVSAKEELAAQKTVLEQKRTELDGKQQELSDKSAQSDALITQLLNDKAELAAEAEKYEQMEAELTAEIAALEVDRTAALRAEWLAAHPPTPKPTPTPTEPTQPAVPSTPESPTEPTQPPENPGGDTPETPTEPPVDDEPSVPADGESWLFPLPSGTRVTLTSPYGYRTHPITGNFTMHNGVDLACAGGTPILATKSGYVTTAKYSSSYGYYVTVNHMNGYSTLYAHMTSYCVANGDYVERGQVIGYVGATGWATGNHLHFTVFRDGSTVNPMDYISMP